ncbi:MAG: FAD-dependent oxidoreductase [bacterium]|nr:FAD-dependent oxidoreductase [Candidatus Sumerlaeota bacterium]
MKRWRCLICGYESEGPAPPDECPVCGAGPDCFEPVEEPAAAVAASAAGRDERIVIIGAGAAGISAAEAARAAAPEAEITVVSNENVLPYYRLNLTRYLADETSRTELPLHPADWYEVRKIRLIQPARAVSILADESAVLLADGARLPYTRLVLAAGADPFVPPFAGADKPGVLCLRALEDADRILDASMKGNGCVCIGGGLLGLETAGALARRGVRVTLIENSSWLMPRQLNRRAAEILAVHLSSIGICLLTNARTKEIGGAGHAEYVELDDGRRAAGSLVVIATGVRPNLILAQGAGLKCGRGVLVDDRLQTSAAGIYAAGDVAEHNGLVYGLWGPAQTQGRIAGSNAAGGSGVFAGVPRANTLKVLGIGVFSAGEIVPSQPGDAEIEAESDGRYCCLLVRGGCLAGAILLGDTKSSAAVARAIVEKREVPGLAERQLTAFDVIHHFT